jgi:hypothetical protein
VPPPDEGESRAAAALTVAWMLTCMSTAVGLVVVLSMRLIAALFPAPGGRHPLTSIASVMLLAAVTTGVLCLVLTPLAHRVRRSQPPRAITVAAVLIGIAPLVTIAVLAALGQ